MNDESTTVAILGAGLAGLCAGRLLHAAGIPFRILEARERAGGRILTVDADGRPGADGFDLGPSWFWPATQPAIAGLVAALRLPAFAQNAEGDLLFERVAHEGPLRYAGQDQGSMRLAGGTAALVRALLAGMPSDCVRYDARVTGMALAGGGVRLTVAGSRDGELQATQVIAALPPRLLEATVDLGPALDPATARRWREVATWMAPHAKFFALYDRPFWRAAGLSGTAQSLVGPLVEIHDATTASGRAALFGFVGLPADRRAVVGEAALVDACVAQLARLFGPQARRPDATLLKDWATDPLTATAADRTFGAHPAPVAAAWVTGAWAQRLALAGSETSRTEPGYLAGAVDAAERAVADTLARLRAAG